MKKDRFEHLTGRQKAACYFIMDTLGVYLTENETPEEFLTKYLKKAKIKAWNDPYRKSTKYKVPYYSLEVINEHGVEIEEELAWDIYLQETDHLWRD